MLGKSKQRLIINNGHLTSFWHTMVWRKRLKLWFLALYSVHFNLLRKILQWKFLKEIFIMSFRVPTWRVFLQCWESLYFQRRSWSSFLKNTGNKILLVFSEPSDIFTKNVWTRRICQVHVYICSVALSCLSVPVTLVKGQSA